MDPRRFVAYNITRARTVAEKVLVAKTPIARAKGLLGRDGLEPGEGLWIRKCNSIHTFFMRFTIDALFLDRGLRVRRVIGSLKPWRLSPWVFSADSVLELAGGAAAGAVEEGDTLEFHERS